MRVKSHGLLEDNQLRLWLLYQIKDRRQGTREVLDGDGFVRYWCNAYIGTSVGFHVGSMISDRIRNDGSSMSKEIIAVLT